MFLLQTFRTEVYPNSSRKLELTVFERRVNVMGSETLLRLVRMDLASSFSALELELSSWAHGGLLSILIAVNPFIVCANSLLQKSSDFVKLTYIFEENSERKFQIEVFRLWNPLQILAI